MIQATGGIVKSGKPHVIGEEGSPCVPFPDPDYRFDVEGITGKLIVVHPVNTNMTDEELTEEIRKSLKITLAGIEWMEKSNERQGNG